MQLELAKYFHDIQSSARALAGFVSGQTWESYQANLMLRRAVEREFEIIGEALAQLARRDAAMAARIVDYRQIIGFRNVLIHGYAEVDDALVWTATQVKLPGLLAQVEALLRSEGNAG